MCVLARCEGSHRPLSTLQSSWPRHKATRKSWESVCGFLAGRLEKTSPLGGGFGEDAWKGAGLWGRR